MIRWQILRIDLPFGIRRGIFRRESKGRVMHFAFILKIQFPDGAIWHMPWQRYGGSRREAEKVIRDSFERDNVYAPQMKNPSRLGVLLDMLDCGECEDGIQNSSDLFEAACKKAARLDAKIQTGQAQAA